MIFKRRSRERERGRRIGAAIAAYMDELEAEWWSRRGEDIERVDPGESAKTIADCVEELLARADGDIAVGMDALEIWHESREERFSRAGDEDRALHVAGVYLSVGLNGIGNLFGFIAEGAPSFRIELAEEGRRRGWRS